MPNLRLPLKVRAAAELELRRRRREAESSEPPVWTPYPETDDKPWSPQLRALNSKADIIGYGGQAGGGKTDLSIGMAATKHKNSIIFRKKYRNLKAIIKRTRELFAAKAKFNGTDLIWRGLPGNREITLAGVQHEKDVENFRGDPYDLMSFDEATQFKRSEIMFLSGWNRSADPDMHCQLLLTFNPPTNQDERWIIEFFAPWLDRTHPNPADPGELRWYTTLDGKEVECKDGTPFVHTDRDGREELVRPLSRTFFPAKLSDNPALDRTNYRATLQMLPEPLRSQVLYGDFDAGVADHEWQIIPTDWIVSAMNRWKAQGGDNYDLRGFSPDVISQDVAQGGEDQTVVGRKYGKWIPSLDKYPGRETPDGPTAAAKIVKRWSGNAKIHLDLTAGHGGACYDSLSYDEPVGHGLRDHVYGVDFGSASEYRDSSGFKKMANLRAEMFWRIRDALNPDQPGGSSICLPDDPELLQDLAAQRYEVRGETIKVEDKYDIKKRIGRSPDAGDCVAMLFLPNQSRASNDLRIHVAANPIARDRGSKRRKW